MEQEGGTSETLGTQGEGVLNRFVINEEKHFDGSGTIKASDKSFISESIINTQR